MALKKYCEQKARASLPKFSGNAMFRIVKSAAAKQFNTSPKSEKLTKVAEKQNLKRSN